MKRLMGRLLAVTLAIACCIGVAGNAFATTNRASFYLTSYLATVSAMSGGDIQIVVHVVANQESNEIGADYICLEESSDGGDTWHIAAEYERERWMTALHQQVMTASTVYPGTPGYQYRVTATVIAYNSVSAQDSRTVGPSDPVTAHI